MYKYLRCTQDSAESMSDEDLSKLIIRILSNPTAVAELKKLLKDKKTGE